MDREIDSRIKQKEDEKLFAKIAESKVDSPTLFQDAKNYCFYLLDLYKNAKINRITFCAYLRPLMWSGVKDTYPFDEIGEEAGSLEIPKHHIPGDADAKMKNLIELIEELR